MPVSSLGTSQRARRTKGKCWCQDFGWSAATLAIKRLTVPSRRSAGALPSEWCGVMKRKTWGCTKTFQQLLRNIGDIASCVIPRHMSWNTKHGPNLGETVTNIFGSRCLCSKWNRISCLTIQHEQTVWVQHFSLLKGPRTSKCQCKKASSCLGMGWIGTRFQQVFLARN